jgi:alcohol dehydrogenase
VTAKTNLYLLFQNQLRLIGSFGCRMANMSTVMDKLARGIVRPVIDGVIGLEEIETGLKRLEARDVFGKIIVTV